MPDGAASILSDISDQISDAMLDGRIMRAGSGDFEHAATSQPPNNQTLARKFTPSLGKSQHDFLMIWTLFLDADDSKCYELLPQSDSRYQFTALDSENDYQP